MELLRRALLIGAVLPGLWLLWLAPLDPLLSIAPVDFAAVQRAEAASVPDALKTDAQRRRAEIPLPVYVEEFLQYNVFPAAGPEWERFLAWVDEAAREGTREKPEAAGPGDIVSAGLLGGRVFARPDEEPLGALVDRLAAASGTTYVSFSRPGGDRHYRVDRHRWTRSDFRFGAGFTGQPSPPAALLYPFRPLGLAAIAAGLLFFVLLPGRPIQRRPWGGLTVGEAMALALALACFAGPLAATAGSVQALTQARFVTLASWVVAAVAAHLFARPGRHVPLAGPARSDGSLDEAAGSRRVRTGFLREGLAFLIVAIGPSVLVVSASLLLWNR